MARDTYRVEVEHACSKHEECRQGYITALRCAQAAFDAGEGPEAVWQLLRANAAIAQGMVWADVMGISESGWLSRMEDVTALHERLMQPGHRARCFAHELVIAALRPREVA